MNQYRTLSYLFKNVKTYPKLTPGWAEYLRSLNKNWALKKNFLLKMEIFEIN